LYDKKLAFLAFFGEDSKLSDLINIDRIKFVINYIEENIKKDLTLEDISDSALLSKYHLHRIFKALTNKSLMGYVRGRKLTHSINDLLYTDLNIVDIAYEYTFKHEQSYIRSFKNMFKISPAKFRREEISLLIIGKLDYNYIYPVANGMVIEPNFMIKPEFYVIGIKQEFTEEENIKNLTATKVANEFFSQQRYKIKDIKNPNIYIGLVPYIPNCHNKQSYIPSCEVSNLNIIPKGMVGFKLETHKYAVFKYIGLHTQESLNIKLLSEIYDFIFLEWMPKTSFRHQDTFHFERIDTTLGRDDYCELDIYIPIEE